MEKEQLEKLFINLLKTHDLYHLFIKEFGKEWKAKEWHSDGWWFEQDCFSYRSCDLFLDHKDGYDWRFDEDVFEKQLVSIFQENGFEITHNGGDEEDGLFCMKKNY